MKIKIIVSTVLALCIGFITHAQAQDNCCGGQPLPAGDECCNNQPIDPNELFCCTAAEESGWQSAYNSCKATAQATKTADDNEAETAYNATVAGCDWVAAEDCSGFTNPSPYYTACYDSVLFAEGSVLSAALGLYDATLAADALTYSDALDDCSTDIGWVKDCADGWTLQM